MTPLIDARPNAASWFARIQARPSYATAISAYLPEPVVQMFKKNGAAVWADVEQLSKEA